MTEEIHPEERKSNELRKKVKIHSLIRQAILFCVVFFYVTGDSSMATEKESSPNRCFSKSEKINKNNQIQRAKCLDTSLVKCCKS